uniref:AB hydrolase-1 domain-containing protein n=1 Tax=Ciona intestinalis TaxID=7719 RepID=H2XXQ9_CIOIN
RGISREIKIPINVGILCGRAFGNPKDPPVLCLHGWQDNCNTFEKLIPLLPKNHYYVAMDMIGHGHSVGLPSEMMYDLRNYIAMIHGMAKYMGWKSFTALGHSLGGCILICFAAVFPEMIEKLILIESRIFWYPLSQAIKMLRSRVENVLQTNEKSSDRLYTYPEIKSRLQAFNKAIDDEAADILLERGISKEKDGKYKVRRDKRIAKLPHFISEEMAVLCIKKLKAPTYHLLAVNGFKNSHNLLENDKHLGLSDKPNHVYIEVKGNHFAHLSEPQGVADVVTKVLNGGVKVASKIL